VAGVLPAYQGRGVGRLLKEHQREWAFARGVGTITWTYDPLVARNAHFNLTVLGARVTEYLIDQYGPMADEVNRGDATDRLMVSWALARPSATSPSPARVVATVPIPPDIESLRRTDPEAAAGWRLKLREELVGQLEAGRRIAGFDRDLGYLVVEND
jgi:predicted GNAT superfamily acetyltransferase